ncbi:MAG TPA: hypothetical protein VKU00_28550 [Chthonomonadaceae bacterium]|nr:hypothetical protein [Chthonomonadaceae bacterium]
MRRVWIYGGILLVVALGVLGYWGYQVMKAKNGVKPELALQEPERQQIRAQLTQFYDAWKAYRTDHKGAEPPSLEAMIPKYISKPEALIDPTAQRWRKHRFDLAPGQVKIGDATYPESYGFRWLAAGNVRAVRSQGDQAILISCDSQLEGLYLAAYGHRAPLGTFDPPEHAKLIAEVRDAKLLVVRRNGAIDEIDPASE